MAEPTDFLELFEFHGVNITNARSKNARANCPFCDHGSSKLYINKETGLYDCKNCGAKGNANTFLQQVYDYAESETAAADYTRLAALKPGTTAQALKRAGLRLDTVFGHTRWLIPYKGTNGKLTNLRAFLEDSKNPKFLWTPTVDTFTTSLWGLERFNKKGPIFLCEGEMDAIALLQVIFKATRQKNTSVLAAPGAGTFKEEWCDLFQNRDVYVLYDNDDAGISGMDRVKSKLAGVASNVYTIEWSADAGDGYDVRDHVAQHWLNDTPEGSVTFLDNLYNSCIISQETPETTNRARKPKFARNTFTSLVKDFKDAYYFTDDMQDALSVCCATVLSTVISSDPIWMFLVGPPGGGKTLLLQAFRRTNLCEYHSNLGSRALISGMQVDGHDPSILPTLSGKTLILKDYTEILNTSSEEHEEMTGILRGAFDGYAERFYGNGVHRVYNDCHFSLLAGVTHVIHGSNRADLGERFLKMELLTPQTDRYASAAEHINGALDSDVANYDDHIQESVYAFLHGKQNFKLPSIPKAIRTKLTALAQIIAVLRTQFIRGPDGFISYRPVPEVGTRVAKQLAKLLQCLAVVHGTKTVSLDHYNLVKRIGLNTCTGWAQDIVTEAMSVHPKRLDATAAPYRTKMQPLHCDTEIANLVALDVLTTKKHSTTTTSGFSVAPAIVKLWKTAGLSQE